MAVEGASISFKKSSAREREEEEAAATISCLISVAERFAGFVRRSLQNAERGRY